MAVIPPLSRDELLSRVADDAEVLEALRWLIDTADKALWLVTAAASNCGTCPMACTVAAFATPCDEAHDALKAWVRA